MDTTTRRAVAARLAGALVPALTTLSLLGPAHAHAARHSGFFSGRLIDPAADEELDVRVNGSAVHYETGWVGCNHHVVPSWADACSFGQGHQTPFRIQHR
ncbi:MAG: hypothetical protein WB797_16510 [Nocardioides sp.]